MEKKMNSIKSFVYLDKHKMYSISSQIFEGLTEYILQYSSEDTEEETKQKGPVGSGRILGDIISKVTSTEQKRFLHDYSYTLFEEKLSAGNKVLVLNQDSIGTKLDEISNYNFIKVTGRVAFNDMKQMVQTINTFNRFGSAIAYVSTHKEIEEQKAKVEEVLRQTRDRNQRAKIKSHAKKSLNIDNLAKEKGLNLDSKYLENLAFLLEYGYKEQFEIQIPLEEVIQNGKKVIFSAVLNRSLLEEDEDILIKKYSRFSEKQFTIFGTITQNEKDTSAAVNDNQTSESQHLKQVLRTLNSTFSDLEDLYIGRLPDEVIIDPIAVYRDLQ